MKLVDRTMSLPDDLGIRDNPEAMEALCAYLQRLIHDLNNPLATLGLELFTIRHLVELTIACASRGDFESVATQMRKLMSVYENLEQAHSRASELTGTLDAVLRNWSPESE